MRPRVIALSGGIGGAKLVLGLAQIVPGDDLLVVANTADDFEHCGYYICPDIDTLLYTLAGVADPVRGWGIAGESWGFMERLRREHPEQAWFQLGDKDLETHRFRTEALGCRSTQRAGVNARCAFTPVFWAPPTQGRPQRGLLQSAKATLTEVTAALAERLGVRTAVVPMSDDPVRTFLLTESDNRETWIPFQEYFVRERCEPAVRKIEYRGGSEATPQPVLAALDASRLEAVVVGPSNPYLSIDPILSIPGMAGLLRSLGAPVIAVSPIVGGRALKGPTAKIMRELGVATDVASIAAHYQDFIDGLVIDRADRDARAAIEAAGMAVAVADTVMQSLADRVALAQSCLQFATALRGISAGPPQRGLLR